MKSRTKMTAKNIFYGYISNFANLLLNFVSRTIFIKVLSTTYLGINGLFSNVLGVLSFAELGIGIALNYNLYKPVAEGNKEKIKSVMKLYKISYRVIALIIAVLGVALIPFLRYIVKDPGDVGNIVVYYIIFLFNTVSGYFVSYKFSLVNAEQKNYVMTNINLVTSFIERILQLAILIITRNFLAYLLTATLVTTIQKIYVNIYLNKMYPYLLEKDVEPLEKTEVKAIKKNVFGLIWHKFGDICVHQTDNIIISAFINITTVGIISNYTMIITSIRGFLNMIFSSAVPSLGNLVATTDIKKQFSVFKIYNFINFWLYGFCTIVFFILIPPFITLWIGKENLIGLLPFLLICIDFYLSGQRASFQNYKTAFGIFYDDKFVVLQAAVINLVVSIICAKIWGITGVYVGTVVTGLYQTIRRPIIAYERITNDKTLNYFKTLIKYLICVAIPGVVMYFISTVLLKQVTFLRFVLLCVILVVVVNGWFYLLFRKTAEFDYVRNLIKRFLKKGESNE